MRRKGLIKKCAALTLALIMSMGTLAGCGKGGDSTTDTLPSQMPRENLLQLMRHIRMKQEACLLASGCLLILPTIHLYV